MQAKSAGEIGCSPDEISISDQKSHLGFVQSGETWIAECRGRTFVCSQINQSGRNHDLFDSLFAAEQVRCHEEVESPAAERARLTPPAPPAPQRNEAPSGAAGFFFGDTLDETQKRCEAAGQAFSRGGNSSCAGPAVPLGIPARVEFGFCDGYLCTIRVVHVPLAAWSRAAVLLKTNVEAKYGPNQETSGSVSKTCRAEPDFKRCLDSRELVLSYAWRWAGGTSLEMSVGRPSASDAVAIRLDYRRPRGSANLSGL